MALRLPLVGESLLFLFYCCLIFLIVLFPPQAFPSPSTAGCGTETPSPSSPRSIFTRSRASREVTRGATSASPGTPWAASSARWSPSPSPVCRFHNFSPELVTSWQECVANYLGWVFKVCFNETVSVSQFITIRKCTLNSLKIKEFLTLH